MTEPQQERSLHNTYLMQMLNSTSVAPDYNAFARVMNSAAKWLWGVSPKESKGIIWRKILGIMVFLLFIGSVLSWLLVPFLTLFPSVKVPWWIYLTNVLLFMFSTPLIVSAPENSRIYHTMQRAENTMNFGLPVLFYGKYYRSRADHIRIPRLHDSRKCRHTYGCGSTHRNRNTKAAHVRNRVDGNKLSTENNI